MSGNPKARPRRSPRYNLRVLRRRNLRSALRPALRPARMPSQLPRSQLPGAQLRPALRLLYCRRGPRRISYIRQQLEPIGRMLAYLRLSLRLRKKAWRQAQKEKRRAAAAARKNLKFTPSSP